MMRIGQLAFLIILSAILLTGVKAQELVSKPLKLSLQIKDTEQLCIGKPFTITARLENVSEIGQLIDKKSLWRSAMLLGTLENTELDSKQPGSEAKLFGFQRGTSYGLLFKTEQQNLILLKPKEFFEADKTINDDDKYFNLKHVDLPGTYLLFVSFFQAFAEPANNKAFFEGGITSDELKFTMKDCKATN